MTESTAPKYLQQRICKAWRWEIRSEQANIQHCGITLISVIYSQPDDFRYAAAQCKQSIYITRRDHGIDAALDCA